jgi:phage terminase large subunit
MSEVIFSDKYDPLFELLVAKEELKEDPTNEHYQNLSKVDTVLISGGRDSGKTFAVSCWTGLAACDYNHRILYTRFTMTSTKNSIKEAMYNRLELLSRSDEFDYADDEFKHDSSNGKITITGQKTSSGTQTARLKSIEDYSMFITEEGEELTSYEDWKKIKRSIRAKDVQCLNVIVFNPPTREHWIADEFYDTVTDGFNGVIDNVMYIHTTYLDNGKENMAEHIWREYEELRLVYEYVESLSNEEKETIDNKTRKQYESYKYDIKGGFKRKAEGVIYPYYELKEFDETIEYKGYGLDFGSNDPDALTKVAVDFSNKSIYIKERYFKNNTSYEGLREVLIDRCGYSDLIVADCAERRLIKDLRHDGLNLQRCDKSMPVKNQIKILQDYTIYIDPSSKNLIKAFNNYVWHDKKAGVPNHDWSDLMDSWRYKAYSLINPKNTLF